MLYRVGYALEEVAKNADNVGLDPAYLVETVKASARNGWATEIAYAELV